VAYTVHFRTLKFPGTSPERVFARGSGGTGTFEHFQELTPFWIFNQLYDKFVQVFNQLTNVLAEKLVFEKFDLS